MNCALNNTSDEIAQYNSAKVQTGDVSGSLPGNRTVTLSSSIFNRPDVIGGAAACVPDQSFTVVGFAVLLPFSRVCPYLAMLRFVIVSLAYLTAALIIFKKG